MVVVALHQPVLRRLGLVTLDQARAFKGIHIKNHRGRRDIVRIETTDDQGAPLVLFLKRSLKPYRKDGLASLLRRGRVWSTSRQEFENARLLLDRGFAAARPVAYGESCGWLGERFSFLISEAAPGSETLDLFLKHCRDPDRRRDVLSALARLMRRLHDQGLASPDLVGRHVFLDLTGPNPGFCLIDMARLNRSRQTSLGRRARDLASMQVSIPETSAPPEERRAFLQIYCGQDLAIDPLRQLIERRIRHLLRQRRHQIPYFSLHLKPGFRRDAKRS